MIPTITEEIVRLNAFEQELRNQIEKSETANFSVLGWEDGKPKVLPWPAYPPEAIRACELRSDCLAALNFLCAAVMGNPALLYHSHHHQQSTPPNHDTKN